MPTKPAVVDAASANQEPSYRLLPADASLDGFVPTSMSFVSTRTGWFLGKLPCGTQQCGVLLQTRDAGRSFIRRAAPPVLVAQVRFGSLAEGWAFGNTVSSTKGDPGLWRTHDGGRSWKKVLNRPVPSLEVGSGSVWAVVLGSDGTTPRLFRGSVSDDRLGLTAQIPNRSATVAVGHGTAYVVAQRGAGPIATTLLVATTSSQRLRPSPCGEQETPDLAVAAGRAHHLVAVCSGESSAGNQSKRTYASADDGRTWTRRPDPPGFGYTGAFNGGGIAATTTSAFVSGFRSPLYKEIGSGKWRPVLDADEGLGFSFLGFTDDAHGVALGERAAWMTDSAGEHWRRLRFS